MTVPAKRGPGAPAYELHPEMAEEICARVATSAESLATILERMAKEEIFAENGERLRVPGLRTAMRLLASNEVFRHLYAQAKELQADFLAEQTIELADDATGDAILATAKDGTVYAKMDGNNVRRAELMVKARQWAAGKLAPRRYGDKIDVTSNGETVGQALPPTVIDQRVASILNAAAERRRLEEEARRLLE